MEWKKHGLIFQPQARRPWMRSYAQVPTADPIDDDLYRVYFGTRDEQNRSRVGYVDLDIRNPDRIQHVSEEPVLDLGERGCFDDNGVTPSWIVSRDGKKYLYYYGWNSGTTVAFHVFVGLAVSSDGGRSFERYSPTPILDRCPIDPFLASAPCVLADGGAWRMWYVSGVAFDIKINSKFYPRYNIKYAESSDGVSWRREGITCLELNGPEEWALSRPCVLRDDRGYTMWFSHKGRAYRLGYAESADGLAWNRRGGSAGVTASGFGWDSDMVEYPYVFDHANDRYMLYNGNQHGVDGFGLAVLAGRRRECG